VFRGFVATFHRYPDLSKQGLCQVTLSESWACCLAEMPTFGYHGASMAPPPGMPLGGTARHTRKGQPMAARSRWPRLMLAAGLLLALVSLFADRLGVGSTPGFGYRQTLGLLVGVALVVLGVWRRR